MNKKPAWMYYAAQAQKRLDDVKPSKSGKREEQCILDTWRTADEKYDYPGTLYDWQTLLNRIARGQIKIEPFHGVLPETKTPRGLSALTVRIK